VSVSPVARTAPMVDPDDAKRMRSFRLSEAQYRELGRAAAERGVDRSALLREWIDDGLLAHEIRKRLSGRAA
jgi:hypothetical protein